MLLLTGGPAIPRNGDFAMARNCYGGADIACHCKRLWRKAMAAASARLDAPVLEKI